MTDTVYHNFETLTSLNPLNRWVFYTGAPAKGGKVDKQPMSPRTEGGASSTNPDTWANRAAAQKCANRFRKPDWKPGVGLVLGSLDDDTALCGVDLDGCLNDGVLEPWAEAIFDRLDTYSEISPSGKGVKAFFRVSADQLAHFRESSGIETKRQWLKGNHYGVELHLSAIYFAVTGKLYGDREALELIGAADRLRLVSSDDLLWLTEQGEHFKGKANGRTERGSTGEKTGRPLHVFRDALMAIPNDDHISYDEWLEIGMALHHEFDGSKQALELFHEWSAQSGKYDADDLDRRWQSFVRKAGRVRTGQYILNLAESHDWRDLERMFGLFTDDMVDVPFGGFLHDEDGAIRAFTEAYHGELLFDHHAGKWFRFDSYWRREETKLALHYARDESVKLARGDKAAKSLKRVSAWEAIERGARTVREFAVTSDVWNVDKMLLGTPGGTVELRTGILRPGLPGDHISRVTAVAPVALDQFEPNRDCPRWLAFLNDALEGDAAAIRFLQQWSGYSLTGETKEQKLVFVYGRGGSGKGTAINTIGDIMGDYAANVGMETLTASKHERHTTELARLRGARMARASETEKGKAWAENRIKNLTGQDTITARFMRQDDFEFLPEFKLTIFGNNRPSLKDVDEAIKRRFLILPFNHQPAKRDPELPERLKGEWPGILAWMIVGCLDWQRNGLTVPPLMDAATRAYFDAEDTFAQWLADCCHVGPEFADTTDHLWKSWSRYAYSMGEEPGTMKGSFGETLSQRGFYSGEKIGPERKRGYRGLHVREDVRDADDMF
jgi:putative DNA primase/helicase